MAEWRRKRAKPPPRPGKPKPTKPAAKPKPVSVNEPAGLHEYRVRLTKAARYLPKPLQGPMFAVIVCVDWTTGETICKVATMAERSAVFAGRYKMPKVTAATLKRYLPKLIEMKLITREDRWDSWIGADGTLGASQISSRTTVRADALLELVPDERECPFCEEMFTPASRSDQQYCSPACRKNAYRAGHATASATHETEADATASATHDLLHDLPLSMPKGICSVAPKGAASSSEPEDDQDYPCGAAQSTPDDEYDAAPSQPPGLAAGESPGDGSVPGSELVPLDGVLVGEIVPGPGLRPDPGSPLGLMVEHLGWRYSLDLATLARKMEEVSADQDILDMDWFAEGIAWWLAVVMPTGKGPGYLIRSLPTIPGQFRSAQDRQVSAARAEHDRAALESAKAAEAQARQDAHDKEKKDAADEVTRHRTGLWAEIDELEPVWRAREYVRAVLGRPQPGRFWDVEDVRERRVWQVIFNLAKPRDSWTERDYRPDGDIPWFLGHMRAEMEKPDEAPPPAPAPAAPQAPATEWIIGKLDDDWWQPTRRSREAREMKRSVSRPVALVGGHGLVGLTRDEIDEHGFPDDGDDTPADRVRAILAKEVSK